MALSEKQKASRENALGSSDAPVAAGVSSYCSPLELYYKLHGELPRYSEDETWEQKVGSKVEPVIAGLVAEELGIKIRRAAPRVHPKHPFMTCNLDFEIVSHPQGAGILEVKRRSCKPFSVLPDDIALQVAHQMAVTNRDWGKVAVQFHWGKPVVFDVERDRELEEYLIEIEHKFIVRVQKGEPPTEDWTPETVDLLKKLYPKDSGQTIELDDIAVWHIARLNAAKELMDQQDKIRARAEGWLKSTIGEASIAKVPGWGEITWKKTKDGKRFDEDQFEKDHPDLYAQYQKPKSGHRVFLLKPNKEQACLTKLPSKTISPPELDSPLTDPASQHSA